MTNYKSQASNLKWFDLAELLAVEVLRAEGLSLLKDKPFGAWCLFYNGGLPLRVRAVEAPGG